SFAAPTFHLDRDLSARRRELTRVVEQIVEHLLQPNRITLQEHGHLGYLHGELELPRAEERSAAFDGTSYDHADVDLLFAQIDLSGVDPRKVGEVVDEPHHDAELPVENGERVFRFRAEVLAHAK